MRNIDPKRIESIVDHLINGLATEFGRYCGFESH